MAALKKQLILVAGGCVTFTALFGYLLSVAVNQVLEDFANQSEIIVPGSDSPPQQPF